MMYKRILGLLLLAAMLLSLAACGASGGGSSAPPAADAGSEAAGDAGGGEAPTKLRIFRVAVTHDPKTDPILLELQKRTNTEIEFVTAPWDQESTKVNTLLSSGEAIDIISLNDSYVNYPTLCRSGAFLELDDLLATGNYPLSAALANDPLFDYKKVDGKAYGICEPIEPGGGWTFGIRKDWLDNVGLDMPETLDDFYEVFRAFREDDPDGNGEKDTYATMVSTFDIFTGLMATHVPVYADGNPYYIYDTDDSVKLSLVSDKARRSLAFINRLYREDLVNKDIFTIKEKNITSDQFAIGKVGLTLEPSWAALGNKTKANNPEAEIEMLFPIPHDEDVATGAYAFETNWNWMMTVLPKTCTNPEKAMELIEYLQSEEGRILMYCGIEGQHYQSYEFDENGDYVFTGIDREMQDDTWAGDCQNLMGWGLVNTIVGFADIAGNVGNVKNAFETYKYFTSDLEKEESEFYDQRRIPTTKTEPVAIKEPLEVYLKNVGRLQSIWEEYRVYLVTAESEAAFDAMWEEYLATMDAGGLAEVDAEAQEYLAAQA